MIDWQRVKRTFIQSVCGAGVALATALMNDFSKQSFITAAITSFATVVIAVLMNIQHQIEKDDKTEK